MLDFVDRKIAVLDAQIAVHTRTFEALLRIWMQMPGLRRVNASSLLAEIGADMNQFPTAAHLASWAAICPGNPWLRRTLCEAACASSRTKKSYLGALYRRLVRSRDKNRALIAVAIAS